MGIFTKDIKKPMVGHFKPDYAPDYLLCCNYICHLAVFKRALYEQLGGERQRDQVAAVVAVGGVAGDQDQREERQELRQADQAEVEQIVRHRVHLPADGDVLHLHGQRGQRAGGQVEGEVAVAQDAETVT